MKKLSASIKFDHHAFSSKGGKAGVKARLGHLTKTQRSEVMRKVSLARKRTNP